MRAVELVIFDCDGVLIDSERLGVVQRVDERYRQTFAAELTPVAGMRTLAFAGGLTRAELLKGPDTVVFEDMRELPGLLG